MDNKFKIVVPVYNAENFIGGCIDSILSQDYPHFEFIVIDDCSTDKTWNIISSLPVRVIRNSRRIGSGLANIITGINILFGSEEDVLIPIDGDDRFATHKALSILNDVYQGDVWFTYGQYEPTNKKYSDFCKPITDTRKYRKEGKWVTSHPKTFKRKVWSRIDDKDFRDQKGEYFKVAWDRAIAYPLIEMSGLRRMRFISDILYIYNCDNFLSDMKTLPALCEKTAEYIKGKDEYSEL